MGRLTTHVLDTAHGIPARGMEFVLHRLGPDGSRELLARGTTNADGRCDAPVLQGDDFASGVYELSFQVGSYFRAMGLQLPEPPFLDMVPVQFGMTSEGNYHVPLLVSPWSFSTYRGS